MINARKKLILNLGNRHIGSYANEINTDIYNIDTTFFAFAYEEGDNTVTNNCVFVSCRDTLVAANKKGYLRNEMDYSSTNLIIYRRLKNEDLHERMLMAKTLLNTIEKANKWKRSKVYKIDEIKIHPTMTDIRTKGGQAEYIVGSKCWIQNMYFLYAYVQILRAFSDLGNKLEGITTLKQFAKKVTGDIPIKNNYGIGKWQAIFQKRLKLFKGVTPKKMYSLMANDGIQTLCSDCTAIDIVNKRFKEMGF